MADTHDAQPILDMLGVTTVPDALARLVDYQQLIPAWLTAICRSVRAVTPGGKTHTMKVDWNRQLILAEGIARMAHRTQVDKAGNPYVNHLLRVAARVRTPEAQPVGWLHDVLEDTAYTLKDLDAAGIHRDVWETVEVLTRRKGSGETYAAYIQRVKTSGNPVALLVKVADLIDHLTNPGCPAGLRDRYLTAYQELTGTPFWTEEPTPLVG